MFVCFHTLFSCFVHYWNVHDRIFSTSSIMSHSSCSMHVIVLLITSTTISTSPPPNIVIMIADDLGYNDVSWHNPTIIMPTLDRLARTGIRLESHYSQPSCSPSRGALLTGRYPINIGLNPGVIKPQVEIF